MEVFIECDSCCSINEGTVGIMHEILGHNGIFSVSKDSLEWAFGSLLEGGLDIVTRGSLFGLEGQVDHGDIGSRHTDRHTSELSVKGREDLSNSLGSTSTGGDQIVDGTTSGTPILSSLGWSIDNHLGGSGSMDGGHESFSDSEFFVKNLGKRGQAVGGTGSVGNNVGSGVLSVIHTHDVHGSISRWGRNDDTLASSLNVRLGLFYGSENSGGFADSVSAGFSPWDFLGVADIVEHDFLSVNHKVSFSVGNFSRVGSVHRIVLELVGSVFRGQEGIVDGDDGGI